MPHSDKAQAVVGADVWEVPIRRKTAGKSLANPVTAMMMLTSAPTPTEAAEFTWGMTDLIAGGKWPGPRASFNIAGWGALGEVR